MMGKLEFYVATVVVGAIALFVAGPPSSLDRALFINLATAGLLASWLIDLPSAVMILALSLACSPVGPGGTHALNGIGALIVVPLLRTAADPAVVGRRWLALALGLIWGLFCGLAHENPLLTIGAGGAMLIVLVATRTIDTRHARLAGINVLLGFAAALIAVAVLQHSSDGLWSAFAVGPHAWWTGPTGTPIYRAFRFTPFVIVAAAASALWNFSRLEWRAPLDPVRARFLAFTLVLAATYAGALWRSNAVTFFNALGALPFVLTLAFRDLPVWSIRSWGGQTMVRALIVAAALWIYPVAPVMSDLYSTTIKPALARYR
jgi:hypothetical protein